MWDKATGRLHNILEGDGSVVNVIEGHPHLPLVAVSGIDYSVKVRLVLHSYRASHLIPSSCSSLHLPSVLVAFLE